MKVTVGVDGTISMASPVTGQIALFLGPRGGCAATLTRSAKQYGMHNRRSIGSVVRDLLNLGTLYTFVFVVQQRDLSCL